MSLQAYVDNSLLGTGKINEAAIYSIADNSVLGASSAFSVKPEEIQSLVKGFTDSGPLYSNGIHIGGTKYIAIKADDRSIYGKKGSEGFCAVKTKQALLIGHYPETVQPWEAANVVEQLADYLIGGEY
ncbi:hypothetical protein N7471_008294 [Penicillium samsonianum]|uniref:uncharacterized protein n=1 Tax=Penicillium samsonianum TaxID=1882272 RepID=UPI002547DCE0|nr:uncharacterized protein N7471_008294 [Penicillium samsonianum]KAJ6133079.1 hypothetical protein N7471_008294 [Penicillium samsonianum]